jgi:branched-chain amino acid transport system permease protein
MPQRLLTIGNERRGELLGAGGLDSIGGAVVAGISLGILELVASGYLDPLMPSGGGLANVFPFLVMIVVLIFKPHGLFGLKRIERI